MNTTGASSPNDFLDNQATAERATAAIRIVVAALDAMGQNGPVTRAPTVPARVFPLAFGWFAAIVRNGELVALAHENGLRHESAANARLVLQHSLALQWLIEGGDPAVDAVEADGYRRAFDLVKDLRDTGWPVPAGFALQPGPRPSKSGALQHQFDNFKDMCALYDGGDQQYVPYRVQSSAAHPSYVGAMAYAIPEAGELSTIAVSDSYVYLIDTARCVILAGHAFAALLTDTSYTQLLLDSVPTVGVKWDQEEQPATRSPVEIVSNRAGGCKFADRCVHAREICAQPPPLVPLDYGGQALCFRPVDYRESAPVALNKPRSAADAAGSLSFHKGKHAATQAHSAKSSSGFNLRRSAGS